jgi:Peptidase family M23
MDAKSQRDAQTWITLSEHTQRQRASGLPLAANPALESELKRKGDAPLSSVFTLWLADNYTAAGQFAAAVKQYESVTRRFGELSFVGSRMGAHALRTQSYCYERGRDVKAASRSIQRVLDKFADKQSAPDWHRLGWLAETNGDEKTAAAMYKRAAGFSGPQERSGTEFVDLARRDLERMTSSRAWCRPTFEALADELHAALANKDGKALMALASPTHFAIGFWGSERSFTPREEALQQLVRDLAASATLSVPDGLSGMGNKRYLMSDGWYGEIFLGPLAFLLTATPYGVEWSGLGMFVVPPAWIERGEPKDKKQARARRRDDDYYPGDWRDPPERGDSRPRPAPAPPAPAGGPLPARGAKSVIGLGMKSPWPIGMNLIAGGIIPFSAQSLGILNAAIASGPFFWPTLAALTLGHSATKPCGFGFGGLYYGWPPTHVGRDFWAVDFARFVPFSPSIPITYGTPVLAVASGIVFFVENRFATGSTVAANEVHIGHFATEADAFGAFLNVLFTGAPMDIYVSEYLHLDGPTRIPVSRGMFVRQGARLGVMDDTGVSVTHHLHFSLHDTSIPDSGGYQWGSSVPPVPMDAQLVLDGECMRSTNFPIP